MSTPVIKITVGTGPEALEIGDWDRVEIESNLLEPADGFSVSCTNKDGVLGGAIAPGDPVTIDIDDTPVMVGRVDEVDYDDEDTSRVTVAGRDLFLYLVDAHVEMSKVKTYKDLDLATLAAALCNSAWGITWLSADTSTELIKRVKVEPGDTPWDVLARQIEKRDVYIWCDPDGTGRIGKPNYDQESLYQLLRFTDPSRRNSNNIIRGRVRESWRDRPSDITVYGQSGNTFTDYAAATTRKALYQDDFARWCVATYVTGEPTTTTVKTKRPASVLDVSIDDKPMIVIDGNLRTLVEAQELAAREMGRRKFDSYVLTYMAKGFYGRKQRVDSLWQPNTLADVNDEVTGAVGSFFVSRRKFIREAGGDFTEVELHPAGVWLP